MEASLRSQRRAPRRPTWFAPPALSRNARTDRKSTRLNSSHDQISYAVFCLKKKKKKNKITYNTKKIIDRHYGVHNVHTELTCICSLREAVSEIDHMEARKRFAGHTL